MVNRDYTLWKLPVCGAELVRNHLLYKNIILASLERQNSVIPNLFNFFNLKRNKRELSSTGYMCGR